MSDAVEDESLKVTTNVSQLSQRKIKGSRFRESSMKLLNLRRIKLVGATGFEPLTFWSCARRSLTFSNAVSCWTN
jgi:hypothetical protein